VSFGDTLNRMLTNDTLMQLAAETAREGMADGRGGPFGAVVAREGRVIAAGANRVVRDRDPTAHAEICAIRAACQKLGDHRLTGCDLFTTCEPCPMCLSAIFWARIDRVYYSATRDDATEAGFDDSAIYQEVSSPLDRRRIPLIRLPSESAGALLAKWRHMQHKVPY
jgi:guanine deaminase